MNDNNESGPVSFEDMYKGSSIKDLSEAYVRLREAKDGYDRMMKDAQKEFDYVRKVAIPNKLEEMGIDSVKVTGVGRVSTRVDLYAGVKPGMQEEAYKWLEENGHGDLIKDFVHYSTLKAFLKEQLGDGEEIPENLFTAEPFTMATVTKS